MKTRTLNAVIAAVLFVVMLFVYSATVAPTVSFWDSAEFVTCAVIMGIPHAPGSPLLSLLGRVMSLIPLPDIRHAIIGTVAWRINLIAVLAAALTVALTYLIIVRLITKITPFRDKTGHDVPIIACAAIASIVAGLSHQFWENAVEIETYMPSLFLSMLAFWLVLRWDDNRDEWSGIANLLLAVYLVGLGLGIHLYAMLILPPIAWLVVTGRMAWFREKHVLGGLVLGAIVLAVVNSFGGKTLFLFLMLIIAVTGPAVSVMMSQKAIRGRVVIAGLVAALTLTALGFSVYPSVMIRAAKDPIINEGDPDTPGRYRDYIERTQYNQGNMYTGMFNRRAPMSYQAGFLYSRYLLSQFPKWGPSPAVEFSNDRSVNSRGAGGVTHKVPVPVLLMLMLAGGMVYHAATDFRRFSAVAMYVLLTSLGLVFYLNMENPQVRERGYFFLGSFHMFHIWLGIGMSGLVSLARARMKPSHVVPAIGILLAIFVTMIPAAAISNHIDPAYSNWQVHDRSDNWIPFDYAVNMLESCEPDAILFAHGDNDTYPLWYAQYVEGVRADVRVINLSILNAPWYIKQLRDLEPEVPITFSDDYIDNRLCADNLMSYRTALWPTDAKDVTAAGITWSMPPDYLTGDRKNGLLSVSSIMTAHIIEQVNFERPIYFSTYTGHQRLIGLIEYMSMEGMVYRLTDQRKGEDNYYVRPEALSRNLNEIYVYRGVTDPGVYKSQETQAILHNYFIGYLDLTISLMERGAADEARAAAIKANEFTLGDPVRQALLNQVLREQGLKRESLDISE